MKSKQRRISRMFICSLFIFFALYAGEVNAVIKLAQLPNWSASSLARPQGLVIRPADETHSALAASWNGYKVVVSEAGDSTPVFSRVFDNEVDSVHSVAVGDFDDDGAVEVAILVLDFRKFARPVDTGFFLIDSVEFHLLVQDLLHTSPVDTVTYVIPRARNTAFGQYYPFPVALSSGDFNNNGKENLALSLGWLSGSYSFVIREMSQGFTRIWDVFPQNVDTTLPYPTALLEKKTNELSFLRSYSYDYDELFSPDEASEFSLLHVFEQTNALHRLPDGFGRCEEQNRITSRSRQSLLVAGDALIDALSAGVLVTQFGLQNCEYTRYVEMFQIDDTLGIQSLWQKNSFSYERYVFHPNRPGRFMAQSGATMYEFNSATGEVIDSTTDPLPSGILGWYDLFGDGQQYLVTLNDTLLEAYGFDFVTDVVDGSDGVSLLPETFALSAPYPNPFNPSVSFALNVAKKTDVTIAVYNVLGQKITTLYSGLVHRGETTFRWDATDYSSGLYFISATTTNGLADTRKAVLLK